ncbi:ATP-binding cassette domain-containing protein [Alsobacter sp. R-9]
MSLGTVGLRWRILRDVVRGEGARLVATGIASLGINLLHLAAPAYALVVLVHLEAGGSAAVIMKATLAVLAALAARYALVDLRRHWLQTLADRVQSQWVTPTLVRQASSGRAPDDGPASDLDAVLRLLGGRAGAVLCDLPWIALFVGAAWMIDPRVGAFLLAASVAAAVTLLAWVGSGVRSRVGEHAEARQFSSLAALLSRPGAGTLPVEPVAAAHRRFWSAHWRWDTLVQRLSSAGSGVVAASAVVTFALVLHLDVDEGTAVAFAIASALLASRTIGAIRSLAMVMPEVMSAHAALGRLAEFAPQAGEAARSPILPMPHGTMRIDDLEAGPAAGGPALAGMHLRLRAGEALAIVGPSGSGKSLLARCLAGRASPVRGAVLLDGVALERWGDASDLPVGYVPQEVTLAAGTIAENIAGFATDADPAAVEAAAIAAGLHDWVTALPQGYGTPLEEGGRNLSAGERQRVGLARALYGHPFVLVLDDPTAWLDGEGERALDGAIGALRQRGGIVVSFHQRPPQLASIDRLAVLDGGRVRMIGARPHTMQAMVERMMTGMKGEQNPSLRPAAGGTTG